MTLKQRGELLDAEERLLGYKKDLAELKIKEANQRAHFIEQNIKITRLQIEILEQEVEQIRKEFRIDRKDILAAQSAVKQQLAESNRLQDDFNKRIESLSILKQSETSQLNQLRMRLGKSERESEAFSHWAYQPTTLPEWNAVIEMGRLHNHIVYEVDVHKDLLQARIEQEKAKVTESEVNNLIIQTWYNLTTGMFDSYQSSEVQREIKQYEKIKADIQSSIASLADKATAASHTLTNNARVSETIKGLIKLFREQKDTIFKNNPEEFNRLGTLLRDEAINDSQQRGEVIAQLIELYNNLIHYKTLTIKKIDTMMSVLTARSQWRGGPQLWKGLKKFIPDMQKFWAYVFNTKKATESISANQKVLTQWAQSFKSIPALILSVFLYLFILILIYLLLKLFLPEDAAFFSRLVSSEQGIGYVLTSFCATIVTFLVNHLKGLYMWLLGFLAIRSQMVDTYASVIFYLLSIPIAFYYIHRFIAYIRAVNSARGYVFSSKRYEERFFLVLALFSYATACIFFLREAVLHAFPKADAPNTLLALNFIVLQVSLILIIAREQVLSLIPRSTPLWEWVYEHLTKYYYFFLAGVIFIIVMSNPYIGYGPTFFYAITRLFLIALLIPFFTALHNKIKQWSGTFFFYGDEEGIKERFRYGRTSYGLFVIASFLALTAFAVVVAINIWGYPVGFDDIMTWLHKGIYPYTSPTTGRTVEVNALHLIRVFLYVVGGIFLAYFINKFVLKRMFDLLLVNVGVQSALLSLVRYIIILGAIIIGLQSIGLSYSILYILAVLGGLGVAGKEIITDFIGYFVILVQRPIKVGDYVRVDPELTGVVRHLTLRSVIMRCKNSVTVIIPNSFVLNKAITNWNYSRTFFAFEDMLLTVTFSADPALVKQLILGVLNANQNILKNPAPVVRLNDFTDNGFQFMVRGFLSPDKVLEQHDIASDIRLEIVRVLRANGLDVGSPTRVLRLIQDKSELSGK